MTNTLSFESSSIPLSFGMVVCEGAGTKVLFRLLQPSWYDVQRNFVAPRMLRLQLDEAQAVLKMLSEYNGEPTSFTTSNLWGYLNKDAGLVFLERDGMTLKEFIVANMLDIGTLGRFLTHHINHIDQR